GRDEQAGLDHQLQQADRFHAYRFTTRVGSGNHDDTLVFVKGNIQWNDGLLCGLETEQQQRMPRVDERYGGVSNEFRHIGIDVDGKKCLGTHEVYLRKQPVVIDQQRDMWPQFVGERRKDTDNLPPHLELQIPHLIIQVKYFLRLNIGRLSRSRLIVYPAFYLSFVFSQYRYAQPSVAYGQVAIGRPSLLLGSPEYLVDPLAGLLLCLRDVRHNFGQRRRCCGFYFSLGIDYTLNSYKDIFFYG